MWSRSCGGAASPRSDVQGEGSDGVHIVKESQEEEEEGSVGSTAPMATGGLGGAPHMSPPLCRHGTSHQPLQVEYDSASEAQRGQPEDISQPWRQALRSSCTQREASAPGPEWEERERRWRDQATDGKALKGRRRRPAEPIPESSGGIPTSESPSVILEAGCCSRTGPRSLSSTHHPEPEEAERRRALESGVGRGFEKDEEEEEEEEEEPSATEPAPVPLTAQSRQLYGPVLVPNGPLGKNGGPDKGANYKGGGKEMQ
ncbi:hypothetical protein EYF80_010396 [Liparis tanakae]|uniref:Uncharacterized protein n=1 Tax=Liparis tanakae TaxID=230148 RepID=A0A4Z2IQ84_9TELE|nr:hypothetical protein EYF80_010396 [Liparis tanakae]